MLTTKSFIKTLKNNMKLRQGVKEYAIDNDIHLNIPRV